MFKQKQPLIILTLLLTLFLLVSTVAAEPLTPEAITSFSFSPSSIQSGQSTTATVSANAASGTTTVLFCFYYTDSGLDSFWPAFAIGSRGTTYTQNYVGPDVAGYGGNCTTGLGGRLVEYSGTPSVFAKLLGETTSFTGTFSPVGGNGNYTIDLLQHEDGTATSGGSAVVTVASAPTDVYVSNTAGCGGNTPCYTGSTALQTAFSQVAPGGTVFIVGTYSLGGATTATWSSGSVTVTGFNTPVIENGGGTCAGAMVQNTSTGTLTFDGVTLDGTCAAGSRSSGILQSASGTTVVKDSFGTIRDFTAAGSAAVSVSNGTLEVYGNTFANNRVAMSQTGGSFFAFANNVTSNTGANAATTTAGSANVKCNYWGTSTISGFGNDFVERLGSSMISYLDAQGAGSYSLGDASVTLSGTDTQVLIDMGRNTTNPPFGNGTVTGLGALASNFMATCVTRGTAAGNVAAISVDADAVTPGATGFRLYEVTDPADCSPADNTACWDYTNGTSGSAGATIADPAASEGNFVIGNEVDPTNINLRLFESDSTSGMVLPTAVLLILTLGTLLIWRQRRNAQ